MKHFSIFSPFILFVIIAGLSAAPTPTPPAHADGDAYQIASDSSLLTYPVKVKAIIDAKCYDCHSVKGTDDDAKDELMWDDLPKLSKIDLMYTMDAIVESIDEGEMPPKDHIKKHPNDALTKEEAKLLRDWADGIASKIME